MYCFQLTQIDNQINVKSTINIIILPNCIDVKTFEDIPYEINAFL